MAVFGDVSDDGERRMKRFAADTYGSWQFTVFRLVFGSYLAIHFFMLAPYAPELFGPHGMIPDSSLLPSHGIFPNLLTAVGSDAALVGAVALLGVLSVLFAVGCARRLVAVALWFGWACLFHRNIFVANPSLPYVGWLLWACAALPSGEPWSVWPRRRDDWRMDPWIFSGAWLLLAAGYTFSGLHKAASESWQNGLALRYVLELPMARDTWAKDLLLAAPDVVHRLGTWSTLLLEMLFLPLCLFRRTRPWAFLAMLGMHAGILLTVTMADLTLGMLMFHLFVVEPDWGVDRRTRKIVVFDGGCGFANRIVGFLLSADTARALRFAVQPTAPSSSSSSSSGQTPHFCYVRGHEELVRSTAWLSAVADMGGLWSLARFLLWIPRQLRDALYDVLVGGLIARFGRCAEQRPIAEHEKPWFVDAVTAHQAGAEVR
jgi:predicted DCC family thiol-disulfide oxidoreductase YuxK